MVFFLIGSLPLGVWTRLGSIPAEGGADLLRADPKPLQVPVQVPDGPGQLQEVAADRGEAGAEQLLVIITSRSWRRFIIVLAWARVGWA